ncbi:MAG: beta strand repeat-containing protein, partial [Candidatus Methylacidiphilales bacterium]
MLKSTFHSRSGYTRFLTAWCVAWMLVPLHLPVVLLANPNGGTVTGGSATISSSGPGQPSQVTVTQTSNRAVVNWNGFSVAKGETTTFVQPSSRSAILNRVTGSGGVSRLDGTVNANGQVYLVNKNGVVVGRTGRVNTAGFTASTHDVSNAEFMAGGNLNFSGTSSASVINQGKIRATDGDVTLIARQVENRGKISARKGMVNLAGGTEVLVKPSGADAGGQRVFIKSTSGSGSVLNTGSIRATAAELRAAGGNEYALAVNNSGVIRATAVDRSGGRIVLKAEKGTGTDAISSGTVQNSGRLIARAGSKAPGKRGGSVVVTGENVKLTSTSRIDVSSTAPGGTGGTVNVGGGYQGKDPVIAHAKATVIEAGSLIDANGGAQGGTVVVWSDIDTSFSGTVTARGAGTAQGDGAGKGGFVEVSSKGYLDFRGTVEAPGGTLLLDPATLTITASGYSSLPGPPYANDPSQSTLNVSLIGTGLRFGNVILSATDAITLNAPLNALSSATYSLTMQTTAPGGTITFNSAASLYGNLSLTTTNLNLNAPITMNGTGVLSGTATTINVGAAGRIQNAVDAASTSSTATVNLAAATYYENVNISGASAKSINITGVTGTVVNGNGNRSTEGGSLDTGTGDGSVFRINAAAISVALDTLTITNGSVGYPGGGGIYISGGATVALKNSTVRNNTSSFHASGILLDSGILAVTDSTIADNSGASDGGGLYNYGGTMTVENSTISNNHGNYGGGFLAAAGTTTTITNSTISGNRADTTGGGIRARGTVVILNSTISDNSSSQGSGIASGISGSVTLRNTIVANSTSGLDIYTNGGTFVDNGYNIVEDVGNVTVFGLPGSNTLTGVDPKLAPLGWYGGPTQTHALLVGSPALNAAGPTPVIVDQRGVNNSGVRNDIGAFEARSQGSFTWTVTTKADYAPAAVPIANSLRMGLEDLAEKPASIVFNIPTVQAVAGKWRITVASGASAFWVTSGVNIDGATQPGWSTSTGPVIILSGANDSRVMIVATSGTVTLNALGITQGYSGSQGGGLFLDNNSYVTLSNSAVYNNRLYGSHPGAGIAISNGTLQIIDSEFYDNLSPGSSGGAIYAYGSTVWINGSTFYNNTSFNYGGAIEAVDLNLLAITNSTFTGNQSQYGGALDLDNTPTLILNTTIAGNRVVGGATGAGIYSYF